MIHHGKYTMETLTKRKIVRFFLLISDKVDFVPEELLNMKIFYNDKKGNPPRRYSNYKFIFT